MYPTSDVTHVDVRGVDLGERRSTALSNYRRLPVGAVMELRDGRDPVDLYNALHAQAPGDFSWVYREHGPSVWTVQIQKLSRDYRAGECCGHCGGGKPHPIQPTRGKS